MVNILILNFGNTGNKGSAALLYSKIRLLNNLFNEKPNYTIAVFPSKGPYEIKNKYDNNIIIEKSLIYDPPSIVFGKLVLMILILSRTFLKRFNLNLNLRIAGKNIEEHEEKYDSKTLFNDFKHSIKGYFLLIIFYFIYLLKKIGINMDYQPHSLQSYLKADYIINTGGDLLTESYGTVLDCFSNILFAIFLNKPFFILAESLGPFNKQSNKIIAKFIFKNTNLITTREHISSKNLLNLTGQKIETTADLAFTMQPAPDKRIKEICDLENIDPYMASIGINASGIISNYISEGMTKKEKYENYLKIMADVADYITEKFDVNVVLLPHVFAPIDGDDRTALKDIYKLIKNKNDVICILNEYEPEEIKGIISTFDLFLGARMHSTVASTSMNIPTIAIAYSEKTYGIIGGMLGYEKLILDVNDLQYKKLVAIINYAWKNRNLISKDLKIKSPMISNKALKNMKLFKKTYD